jgi:ribosome biogenesis GTPase
VDRVDFGQCRLAFPDGRTAEATVRARLMGRTKALGNAVVVGDRVACEEEAGRLAVTAVHPRRNAYARRASGERLEEQVVAANLDQVVVVAALADPPFRSGLVDRMTCQAEHAGIPARVVLNKTDLGAASDVEAIVAGYGRAGYPVHPVSATSGAGVAELRHALRERRSLVVGHSGVGKSTLINALFPGLALEAGAVNPRTGRGRHTTTAAWLLRPEPGLEVIDTPGVRSFGLWGVGARDLEQTYLEFRRHLGECRFGDCRHEAEPGCALRAAVAAGEIAPLRFESFRKLREELEGEERRLAPRGPRARATR